jgi:hypothetical protein
MGSTIWVEVWKGHPDVLIKLLDHIILPERVSLPIIRQKDPSEVGVPFELDAKEIIDFPLMPVSRAPDQCHRWDAWALARELDLDHNLV